MPDTTHSILDALVMQHMRERKIPGLSLAIVEKGKIVRSQGYGFTDETRRNGVVAGTLFQSGSISKPVAALAALRLVERAALALDDGVNHTLQSWKVPENALSVTHKVTLRRILSHGAGLTVHGFHGYHADEPVPTLLQILDGEPPANSAPVRIAAVPGSGVQYSGGGYVVLQQLMLDVARQTFPELMRDLVLDPARMAASTYEQPLPEEWKKRAATGHYPGGERVPGHWHVYPEMAAAGLWSTPSDLARFIIVVQQALAGSGNSLLSEKMAGAMCTPQHSRCGLGFFLDGDGPGRQFYHEGRDEGFDAIMVGTAESGHGAVVMINSNDDTGTCGQIVGEIARLYRWA